MEEKDYENPKEQLSVEEGFSKLEEIIRNMEGGSQSIEDAFKEYQKGILLVKDLDKTLTDIEKKLEIFNKSTGELETEYE